MFVLVEHDGKWVGPEPSPIYFEPTLSLIYLKAIFSLISFQPFACLIVEISCLWKTLRRRDHWNFFEIEDGRNVGGVRAR